MDDIVVVVVLVVGIGSLFWFRCWLLFGVGSDGVGDGEDKRMVAINECASDGVVVTLLCWRWGLARCSDSCVGCCLFVGCLLFARTSLSRDVA